MNSISAPRGGPMDITRTLSNEMFRLAVEACPNGMVMTDAKGIIVMVNSEVEKLFGYARADLVGHSVAILVPERLRTSFAGHFRNFMLNPETRRMGPERELFGRRKDGVEIPLEVGLNPFAVGEELMVLSVIIDISQRKRHERLKDEFIATVSHELRTPLTSISASLGLLIGCWANALPESATRLLTIAHGNSQRLARLINDILDIQKMESGQLSFNLCRVNIVGLVERAIADSLRYASTYGVTIGIEVRSINTDAKVDPDRLVQVITNLLSNAIKFSPTSGSVEVVIENMMSDIRISVRDHGAGVPDDFKSLIFQKFALADATDNREKGGTGLGLSIVKQIVERLDGRVGFSDAPGGGTIFYVDLPAWNDDEDDADPATASASPRILICESDPAIKQAVRGRLRRAGFVVDFACTVENAMARCASRPYAAMIVDPWMQDGIGFDLIAWLRGQHPGQKTLVIVACHDPQGTRDIERSRGLDVVAWIDKPVDSERLTGLLRSSLAPRRQTRPRILHVDDDRDVLGAIAHELGMIADVISADSPASARRVLATDRIDLAIIDVQLGDESGLELLPDLRDTHGEVIPVIIFSKQGTETSCDDQVSSTLSKTDSSLERLHAAVRDRLSLTETQTRKEVA
jgi:PAS domain S-box-containing protein